MTTYDDPKVNELIGRIRLITHEEVRTLSAVIEVDTADGRTVVQNQQMTAKDYAYDRATVSKLIRRIGNEQGVPATAFDRLEAFIDRWPATSIAEVLMSFATIEAKRKAA